MKLPILRLTFAFYDGVEVVQLYLRDLIGSVTLPVKRAQRLSESIPEKR